MEFVFICPHCKGDIKTSLSEKKIDWLTPIISIGDLHKLYVMQKLHPTVIAKKLNCSVPSVRFYLKKYNLKS